MELKDAPVASAQMMIRRPVEEVFDAFVDPAVTTRFWFTRSSGRLEPGAVVRWDWEMYGVGASVQVKEIEPNRRILIAWGDPPTEVEWSFVGRPDGTTMVEVTERGFAGTTDEVMAAALDSKGGFTSLLAGAKALLEHGIELRLVADQHPDAHVS